VILFIGTPKKSCFSTLPPLSYLNDGIFLEQKHRDY